MKSLEGTQTYQNLIKAFNGELQTRSRYIFYGEIARKQGYPLIKKTFELTAKQEYMHGKVFLSYLKEEFNSKTFETKVNFPVDLYQEDTLENLLASIELEAHEHEVTYPLFAKVAGEEGFSKIATTFDHIAEIEFKHSRRFAQLATELKEGTLFKKVEPVSWHCEICGHIHVGKSAPTLCAVCQHLKVYFIAEISQ